MRLSRQDILAGALDLLDEVGADNLTMRRLATALGVTNGATYWHFASKQVLLAAMAESMLAGVTNGLDRDAPWWEQLTATAHRLHAALKSRRDGARIFAGAFFPEPNALAYGETMIGILREAGMSPRDAVWTVDTITYYVVGHTIEEQAAAGLAEDDVPDLRAALDPELHPNTLAAIDDIPAPHPPEHFDHGLELIISGLRTRLGVEVVSNGG
ncbi:TetR/AcrR family transcriptional regulator C-terminal domain-containing protein [Kutzneria kofuensis]|uniref:TetR/AcrR family tetracycline transcriptional repressor n=1 Tax=Kutzneria kofuensis TaxID=103725 RepID=A0A7W9NEE8_9PSEU|nr:TetR/AcrR family transcriptional regulator C-terminal domain-containing protein [Kutzneria kofuensis]MBB5890242.1 TetR/AcrR family tetracycline transcriptional repressor [Kutzneria kofuensis]